ncbi:class I SAM-dependent methyltransferase [Streptomyces apocyni]|uniref:class I SAM-dependent methyltransferase n=1 Tax=Streptomyces apocyni TaxID=2654677 RepID=UPI001E3FDB0D|nr:class I SAM-dependent methyltransferase [Streptomyces apocyni]
MTREPERQSPVAAATAVYSASMLRVYDAFVLGGVCPAVWRCPRGVMAAQYDRHISDRHLDIGPGTGYFLDRCHFPTDHPQLALLDLNPAVLKAASRRVARYHPTTHRHNILEPYDLSGLRFSSASLNFVLHCLPGPMSAKAAAFDHLIPHLTPGAQVFGSTVLGEGVPHTPAASAQLDLLNRKKVFNNRKDSPESLEAELTTRFSKVTVTLRGSVALFTAQTHNLT